MSVPASPKVVQVFLRLLRARSWIAGAFLILAAAGIYGALQVPDDPAIERLIVAGDPVARRHLANSIACFPRASRPSSCSKRRIPWALAALRAADRLEHELARIPHVEAHSLLDLYRRAGASGGNQCRRRRAGAHIRDRHAAVPSRRTSRRSLSRHCARAAREFARRARPRAGGDRFAGCCPSRASGGPFTKVRRVGSPWLDAWLERQTGAATARFMPLFGIFLMTLVLIIYRSWRALAAIVLTLGALVAIAMGLARSLRLVAHGDLHPGAADRDGHDDRHARVYSFAVSSSRTIRRRFSSITRVRSRINFCRAPPRCSRPRWALPRLRSRIFDPCARWACGPRAGSSWRGSGASRCFRRCSRCCARRCAPEQAPVAKWFPGFVDALVPASRRFRWPLVGGALVLMLCGAAALFGIPGVLSPLALEMDVLTYVNPSERVAQDTRHFEEIERARCALSFGCRRRPATHWIRTSCARWSS